jgi:outer membrane biosynthesis protein TonB
MANPAYMTDNFESEKNLKASGYTLMVCVLIAIILLFITWTLPNIPPPPLEDGIEVNLGNNDKGLGTDQPFLPGKPSPQDQEKYTPPKQSKVESTPVKDVETNDKDADAPVIKKPLITKPDATKIPEKDVAKKIPAKVVQPVVVSDPPKPKPKAVFHGVNGDGKGGNDADDYKPGANQGVAGGKGDQGQPGGNPNSNNYVGNGGTGHSGVTISRGLKGRGFVSLPSFTGDFNENAKVAVDIHVDANGNVTEASYQLRGSTTSESQYISQAIAKAKQVKMTAGSDESVGTIIFNFKVRN